MKSIILSLALIGVVSHPSVAQVQVTPAPPAPTVYNGTAVIENKFLSFVMKALQENASLRPLLITHTQVVAGYYKDGGFWDPKSFVLKTSNAMPDASFPGNQCLHIESRGWMQTATPVDCANLGVDLSQYQTLSSDGLEMLRTFFNSSWGSVLVTGIRGDLRVVKTEIKSLDETARPGRVFVMEGFSQVGSGQREHGFKITVTRTLRTDGSWDYDSRAELDFAWSWGN